MPAMLGKEYFTMWECTKCGAVHREQGRHKFTLAVEIPPMEEIMFYAERIEDPITSGKDTWIAERGVFASLEEFIPSRRQGWSGTQETNAAADALIAEQDAIELCCDCDQPTGNAGRLEDSIYIQYPDKEVGPLCEECRKKHWVCEECGEGVYPINVTYQERHERCGGVCS